jgi:hypothetical protein
LKNFQYDLNSTIFRLLRDPSSASNIHWSSPAQWLDTLDESRLAESAADVPVPETEAELIKVETWFTLFANIIEINA